MTAHPHRTRRRAAELAVLLLAAIVFLLTTISVVAFARDAVYKHVTVRAQREAAAKAPKTAPTSDPEPAEEDAQASSARGSGESSATSPSVPATPSVVPSSAPATPTKPPAAAPKPPLTASAETSIDAYKGLGSWVDIWDDAAWKDPSATVRDMKSHGVRTLFLETGNSKQPYAVKDPARTATFIRAAHANGIKVVAWYLPEMKNVDYDFGRVAAAIRFRTSDGQKFDSFALDIESPAVADQTQRNANLAKLNSKIRGLVGKGYPLGAIIPSPVGLSRTGSYWSRFPYAGLAQTYDVFVPMSYFTWHGNGNVAARDDTLANMRILRSKPGCGTIPVHLIGGETKDSTPSEVRAFVQAANQTGAVGASLYSWPGMNDAQWAQLAAINR